MQTASRDPSPFVVVVAAIALLPGLAAALYYALDAGLRAALGWHAAWLLLWCGACVFVLARALIRRSTPLRSRPHRRPSPTHAADVVGPLMPM